MFAPSDHRPLGAHIWDREPDGFYVEPFWVSERLFEVEKFTTSVWDTSALVSISFNVTDPMAPISFSIRRSIIAKNSRATRSR